jgi:DNA-binding NarL/FixJ family response regulator
VDIRRWRNARAVPLMLGPLVGLLAVAEEGLTNAEIPARMYLGEATLKTHLSRILVKLGLKTRVRAVVFAYRNGLVRG